jgi:predicted nucleic acid-binding protein
VTVTLVDTGPIVALFDASEPHHARCREALEKVSGSLVTSEAVIAEACWLLRRCPGASRDLMLDIRDERYLVDYRIASRAEQIAQLMAKYGDIPISLADACLVDLANLQQTGRILTLDRDFSIYRWGRNRPFELLLNA